MNIIQFLSSMFLAVLLLVIISAFLYRLVDEREKKLKEEIKKKTETEKQTIKTITKKYAEQYNEALKPKSEFSGYSVYVILSNKSKHMYIGMTNSYEKRKAQHFNEQFRAKQPKVYLYYWFGVNGEENFEMFPLIKGLTRTQALYFESAFIRDWGTISPFGYNVEKELENRQLGLATYKGEPVLFDFYKKTLSKKNAKSFLYSYFKNQKTIKPIINVKDQVIIPDIWENFLKSENTPGHV